MLNSLFINLAILVSFLYFASQLFKNQEIGSQCSFFCKLTIGGLFGICGCLLMLNGMHLSDNLIIDFRTYAIMSAIIFCGPLAGAFTALILIAFRAGYFGINYHTTVAVFSLLVLFILFAISYRKKFSFKQKYILMTAEQVIVSMLIFQKLISCSDLKLNFSYEFALANIFVGTVLYFTLTYTFRTNQLYLQLQRDSMHDSLTGLYNVRAFDLFFNQNMNTSSEKRLELSLLMLDIDFFKKINDTYGHASGDMVLKQLSNIITSSCSPTEIVSRNGGEEFTVILPSCGFESALGIANTIRTNVELADFLILENQQIKLTVSIGLSSYPATTSSPLNLLRQADDALYLAKRSGRNIVKCVSPPQTPDLKSEL